MNYDYYEILEELRGKQEESDTNDAFLKLISLMILDAYTAGKIEMVRQAIRNNKRKEK